jgi:pimeloyl-ACP methyl ester carboxylesterase
MQRRKIMVFVSALLGGYVAWCCLLYALQDSMFFPGRVLPGRTPNPPSGLASRWLTHPDGVRTEYWVTDGEVAELPLVVFLHGNGHRIEDEEVTAEFLRRHGYGVVLPEYRGYGSSEGQPSERAITGDLVRIIDDLTKRGVNRDRVAYWGRSIGACFAALLAVERPARGLVLQTPLARADRFALSFGAPTFLVKHPLRADLALARSTAPTLLIQHTRDDVVSPKDTERLHAIRPDAELVRIDAAHNDSGTLEEQAKEDAAIVAFLDGIWARK